jgi:peptide deformylase
MAIREILVYEKDKDILRKRSKPVAEVNQDVKDLIEDLKDTLDASGDGIGLAAPQIGEHHRVVLVRFSTEDEKGEEQAGPPIALINPKIVEARDGRKDFDGCLSFPGLFGETNRPHYLRLTGLYEDGEPFDEIITGFDAVVVHHEIDHLNGVLFIDRVDDPLELYRVRKNEDGELERVPAEMPQ